MPVVQAGGAAASHALSVVSAERALGLFLRHPERYARARTALAVTTAAGFVCFWLFPVAPPRLLPGHFGIVDTLRAAGPGHVEATLISTAGDQYASMPSLHVAWAVWCALACHGCRAAGVERGPRSGGRGAEQGGAQPAGGEEAPVRRLEPCLQTSSSGSAARTG